MKREEFLDWPDFKAIIDEKGYDFKEREVNDTLILEIHEKKVRAWTRIHQDGDMPTELAEYLGTYQEKANQFLYELDGDGTHLIPASIRIDWSNTKVDLPRNSQDYHKFFNQNGAGRLFGFEVEFNSDNVYAKLEIDNN